MPSVVKRRKPPRFKHSRNGLREAILGLLAIRPMTGYDLSRSYRRALRQVWYAPLGQVYPTLRKMRRDGLLRVSVKVQRHRPNRKIYSLYLSLIDKCAVKLPSFGDSKERLAEF